MNTPADAAAGPRAGAPADDPAVPSARPGWFASAAAAAAREWRTIRQDRWALARAGWLPLVLLVIVAAVFQQSVLRDVPIAVVVQDRGAVGRALVRDLQAVRGIHVAASPASLEEAWSLVRSRAVYAVVHVPADTTHAVARAEQATVLVAYNASFMTTGQAAARDIGDAIHAVNVRLARSRALSIDGRTGDAALPVRVQTEILSNGPRSYEHFLAGLLFPAILQFAFSIAVVSTVGAGLGGWPTGPDARPLAELAGRISVLLLLFTLYGALAFGWVAAQGGGVAGSVGLLMAGYVALLAACAAIGVLFVGVTRDTLTALSGTSLFSGVALAYSGATFPTIDGPLFTRIWSELMPFTSYLRLQSQQLDLGAPWTDSLPALGVLAGFTLLAGLPGTWLFLCARRGQALAAPAGRRR